MSFVSKRRQMMSKYGNDFADRMMGLKKEKKEEFNQEISQDMRKSYFTPEESILNVEPQEDGEAMQEGVDVLRKRRGSIFGNNMGTIFGN